MHGPPTARERPSVVYERSPGAASATLDPTYRRREPEKTLLYQFLARELPAYAASMREASDYGQGMPGFVDKELLGYLDCGLLCRGLARVTCADYRHEMLVAWSCKGRGLCPSCTTRRMNDVAAHLVDRVLPHVPVLSAPTPAAAPPSAGKRRRRTPRAPSTNRRRCRHLPRRRQPISVPPRLIPTANQDLPGPICRAGSMPST